MRGQAGRRVARPTSRTAARSVTRRWLAMGTLLAMSALVVPGSAFAQVTGSEDIRVGGLQLERCSTGTYPGTAAWCGALPRPLSDDGSASLLIRFTLVLPEGARPGKPEFTDVMGRPLIAAFEGGPGYGGIDSGEAYAQMLGPLMAQRALLVMDARGTGRSGAIDCHALQQQSEGFLKAARACGRQLGVHAADYGTARAADDAAAVITSLGFPQADVYGDSYGTFMAQVLAGRHPALVRSMVLDGAYPATGESPWYPTQAPALRRALTEVCEGDRRCREQPHGTVNRLARLVDRLRDQPVTVVAPGADGARHRVRITPAALLDVAFNGTYVDATYREFDPAVRAALAGDPLPLGRLVAEMEFPVDYQEPARENSAGQFLAVTCQDYPQLYDMAATVPVRRGQLQLAIDDARQTTPRLFAPFTIDDYVDSTWETVQDCLTWAHLSPSASGPPVPLAGAYPDIPVLVLSGSLDTITTTAEGDLVAAQFPRSRHVEVRYGVHVQAMGEGVPCAADLVRAFFENPDAAVLVDSAPCSAPRPQLHPTFARTTHGIGPGEAAKLTVADIVNRVRGLGSDSGSGLRGGAWSAQYDDDVVTLELEGVQYFEDVPVSGRVTWNSTTGSVRARVTTAGRHYAIEWSDDSGPASIRRLP